MRNILLVVLLLSVTGNLLSQTSLVNFNSTWKYLDNGSNQGTAWRATVFNDASWSQGTAQFGYGDGDEATVVSFGNNSKKKYTNSHAVMNLLLQNYRKPFLQIPGVYV